MCRGGSCGYECGCVYKGSFFGSFELWVLGSVGFLKICLFLAALGLFCCTRAFSSCGKQGLLIVALRGLRIAVSSLIAEHRLLGARASVVVAHGLSCSAACGIYPDQGSNPCPLHCQTDSQPLRHQGSPSNSFFKNLFYWSIVDLQCCVSFWCTEK